MNKAEDSQITKSVVTKQENIEISEGNQPLWPQHAKPPKHGSSVIIVKNEENKEK